MTEKLTISGGTPVLERSDYKNWPIITDDDRRLINEVLDSGIVAGGTAPQVSALEKEWAEYTGAKHCLTTTSGTAALHMALAAVDVGPGDEVITSAFTFLASASCALHQNAIPVFVDIDPRTYNMDPAKLEQVVVYPLKEESGNIGSAIIRISDITEARSMERHLMQSEKLASLGFLISGVAHEINNPNNFITFNLPILRDYLKELIPIVDDYAKAKQDYELFGMSYPEFRKDIFKLLENIEHGSRRINTTVSNLRQFSRKKDKQEKEWVDIKQVVERGIAISAGKIKSMVNSMEINIPEGLPSIYTDPETLEIVLINLLINAAQATDKEDSWLRLNVSLGNRWRDRLVVEVIDNGCGMDGETMAKIFDPFFTTKSPGEGTGLGLSLCHNLIEALGGRIEVDSTPGEGSTFRVILTDKDRRLMKRVQGFKFENELK